MLATTAARVSYQGNAVTTAFTWPYDIISTDQLAVYLVDSDDTATLQSSGVTITLSGSPTNGVYSGATVTFSTAPSASYVVRIDRTPELTQEFDFDSESDPLPVLTRYADLTEMKLQSLQRQIDDVEGDAGASNWVIADGSTTPRSLADRFAEQYNALDWGVTEAGTGAANSTALQAAVTAALAAGVPVYIPAGRYTIATAISNLGVFIYGDGDKTVLVKSGSGAVFTSFGSEPTLASNTLASNASRGALSFTLSSGKGANFSEDSYAVLLSEGKLASGDPQKLGEFVRIRDITGDVITPFGPLKFSYATADTAQLCTVSLVSGVHYAHFAIEMDTSQTPIAAGTDDKELTAIHCQWCYEPKFENITINGGLGSGIRLEGCLDARINAFHCNDLGAARNDADGTSDRGTGGYGYAILERGLNMGLVATDLHITRCRHGYTTGGSYDFTYGCPTGSKIAAGVHVDSKEAGWDTHECGYSITFDDLRTIGSGRTGFQIRSRRTKVLNCTATDCFASGIWLYGAAVASNARGDECYVANFSAENTNFGSGDAYDGSVDWRELGAIRDQGYDNVVDGYQVFECGGPALYLNTATKRGVYRNGFALDPCQLASTNTQAVFMAGTTTDTPRITNLFVRDNDANVTDLVRTSSLNVTPELINVEGVGHSGSIFSSAGANNNARVMLLGRGAHSANVGFREDLTIASDALTITSARGGCVQLVPESSTSDDLATLTGGEDGDRVLLYVAGAYTITVKDGTGNIQTRTNTDAVLVSGARMQLTNHAGTWYEDWRSANDDWEVIGAGAAGYSVTGTAAETALATVTIPANRLGPNGIIRVTTLWTHTNSGNNKTLRTRFSGTTGTVFGTAVATTTATTHEVRVIQNRNSAASQVGFGGGTGGFGSSSSAVVTATEDTTTSKTISISGQLANTGETITLERYMVEVMYRP